MGLIFLLLIAGAPVSLYYWWRKLQQLRLIEGTPLSRCRSVAQGYVALSGIQKAVPGHLCVGPMTGKQCTWWSYTVEHLHGQKGEQKWSTISEASSSLPFILDDGTGQVMIAPEGAKVTCSSMDRWRGDAAWPTHVPSGQAGLGDYRYTEMRMCEGDPLFATGDFGGQSFTEAPTNGADAISSILSAWKGDQATLLARFDTDHDGKIDLDEWDKVREAARVQARNGTSQPEVKQPEPILSSPSDGRPFLLSLIAEKRIVDALRLQVRYALVTFAACTAGALWIASKLSRH